MPLSAPVAFPLFPIVDGVCACGAESCARIGKHPQVAWGDLALGDPVPRPAPGAGYGLKTGAAPKGSGVIVVDLDGPDAMDAWAALGPSSETYTVETPRGVHLYFAHPGFHVGNSAGSLAKGVDVRGDGGFVVGPGSPHRSGGRYEVVLDVAPVAAPEWLLDWLRARPVPAPVQTYAGDVSGDERVRRRGLYTEYLKTTPPCVQGAAGDQRLFQVVQYGAWDLSLPTEDVLELVTEHFDSRCEPPWGDELVERVGHKAHSAKTSSTRPRAEPAPEGFFLEMPPRPDTAPSRKNVSAFVGVPAKALAEPLPPVFYVMQHFGIARGRPTLFAGYGGLGKTVVAQALALHIAAGLDTCWDLPITGGPVWHFDYEMTRDPLQRRYQRLAMGHGIDLSSCDLHLCSMPEIYLSDDRAESELCRATEGVTLAVLDNLAAASSTAQVGENESGIRRYLDRLTRVTNKTGCVFLVLAHERKSGRDEEGGPSSLQRVRGSSAITDACGSVLSISAEKTTGILTLEQNKSSLRQQGGEIGLQIKDVTFGNIGARVQDDSPGLAIVRVNTDEQGKLELAKREADEKELLEAIKQEMLLKLMNTSGPGIGKLALQSMCNGQNQRKRRALEELIESRDLYEFHHMGKLTVAKRP